MNKSFPLRSFFFSFKSYVSVITNIHTNTAPFLQLIKLKLILIHESDKLFGLLE